MNKKNQHSTSIMVRLTAINVVNKPVRRKPMGRKKTKVFDYVQHEYRYKIDPELAQIQFMRKEDLTPRHVGILTMRKDDIRKLELMVGDTIRIEVSRA